MERYANCSKEVLYREGKLVGFNVGYGYYSEHESEYRGKEQIRVRKGNDAHPFNGEIVENPKVIKMIDFVDWNVWITNDIVQYMSLMKMSERERYNIFINYIKNDNMNHSEANSTKPKELELVF